MQRILLLWLIVFAADLQAQTGQKRFTSRELFGGEFPELLKTPPEIVEWADNRHYIEKREDSLGRTLYESVDIRTGKRKPYEGYKEKEEIRLPRIGGAVNLTASPDGKYAAFTRENDLYVIELASGTETRLTHDGSDVILNGYASWVYYEEILGRATKYKAFWWSPDSRSLAFMRFDDSRVPVFPIYVADGTHGYLEQARYPKAGDENPRVRIGVIDIAGLGAGSQNPLWLDFPEERDQYFGTPWWSPDNSLWVQWMNRSQDSLLVYRVDRTSGDRQLIYTENQRAWITLDDDHRFYFLPSGNCILRSDRDGWTNLYLIKASGGEPQQLTEGPFWATEVVFADEKSDRILFRARKEASTRMDYYVAGIRKKGVRRVSFGDYYHELVSLAPDGRHLILQYSNLRTPPAIAIVDDRGRVVRRLGDLLKPEFHSYSFPRTEIFRVNSSDGKYALPVMVTFPLDFDSTKKYPVWISIYGGPGSTLVYDRWRPLGGFPQWWAQEGLVQVTIDNRSSGHFGKKGMEDVFRQLGKLETEDFMTCGEWLKSKSWVDPARVGITGGSFGGYLTCMAMTYGSPVFTHGLSNYPVTDWRLYDTHYTERYMRRPQDNPGGYDATSVMRYTSRYRGLLRIVHGSSDDNVHMQNAIQLIDDLQNKNKIFEMMIYPGQRHGIGEPKRRHHLGETARFIYTHMLRREPPAEFR